MKEVLKQVDYLLTRNPGLVNSDKKLQLSVWSGEGLKLTREQRAVFLTDCTPASSIDRSRRHLQPKYIDYVSESVATERRVKQDRIAKQLSKRYTLEQRPLRFELTPLLRSWAKRRKKVIK